VVFTWHSDENDDRLRGKMENNGKLYVIGIGPGNNNLLTVRAKEALERCEIIVGYATYLNLIDDFFSGKEVVSSRMTQEVDRCQKAIEYAQNGKTTALISGGDPGVFGMAGPLLELVAKSGASVDVEIIPGISAAQAASAILGSPLMHDHCIISLSDRLTPWEIIQKRLHSAAQGDFVTVLYNPQSMGRPDYLRQTAELFLYYRTPQTPVGIVKNAARSGETKLFTTLELLGDTAVDMFSIVIVGNSKSYICDGYMITPRGYDL
jgi:precorrin-3B C17-methyltransferase